RDQLPPLPARGFAADGQGIGSGTADPGSPLIRARLRTERLPHLGVQRPPGSDLAAHRRDSRLKRIDDRTLIVHAPAQLCHLVPVSLAEHVLGREADSRHRSHRSEGPVDDPARKGDAQYARAIPVDDEEAERGLHPLIGTTTPCGDSAGLAFVIQPLTSSIETLYMTMIGAPSSPF